MKVKASKSPWLQKLFLANLTLFLDSDHFNQSEWERLEHFAPPFGFMELNHSRESVPRPEEPEPLSLWLWSGFFPGGPPPALGEMVGRSPPPLQGSERSPSLQWCRRW